MVSYNVTDLLVTKAYESATQTKPSASNTHTDHADAGAITAENNPNHVQTHTPLRVNAIMLHTAAAKQTRHCAVLTVTHACIFNANPGLYSQAA